MSDQETRFRRQRDEDRQRRREERQDEQWHKQRTPFKPQQRRRDRNGDAE